jgi:hypothetical protein
VEKGFEKMGDGRARGKSIVEGPTGSGLGNGFLRAGKSVDGEADDKSVIA